MVFKNILPLIAIVLLLVNLKIMADDIQEIALSSEDKQWIQDLKGKSTAIVWESLSKQFNNSLGMQEGITLSKNDQLYIFVSSSMPVSLLKQYFKAASRYDGVLVFKGLPNGSFKYLSKLIMEIAEVKLSGTIADTPLEVQIIIDEEAFSKFNVQEVPTIVLSLSQGYVSDAEEEEKYDKIIGNVGVRYALEKFSKEGELQQEATRHLNFKRQE